MKIDYIITKDYQFLRSFLKSRRYPHAVLSQLKENPDQILVDGKPARLADPLYVGSTLSVIIHETKNGSVSITPVDLPISVVYEDDHLLVVDKPHGMSIHPSLKFRETSLANAVRYYSLAKGEDYPIRCINRLDKETTGLTIMAKDMLSAAILGEDISKRRIRREYMAICEGHLPEKSGTIEAPIGRAEGSAILRCVDHGGGQPAVTHYQVIDENETHSLVSIHLETGRCHQIRIHFRHIGHPLPADYLYHPRYDVYDHLPLHACHLEFQHPITQESISLTSDRRLHL